MSKQNKDQQLLILPTATYERMNKSTPGEFIAVQWLIPTDEMPGSTQ